MTPKRRRLLLLGVGLGLLASAAALALTALDEHLVFFYGPTELRQQQVAAGTPFRLGGLVEQGSVHRESGSETISFVVTDLVERVPVVYTGLLPDLFREGQGVVAEGALDAAGTFVASEVLAKHDETYMPKEVADALRAAGEWRGEAAQ